MKTVNPYFLDDLMSPVSGLADDDDAYFYYRDMNIDSEEKFRKIIREQFVSYYNSLPQEKKDKAKIALSYYLSKPNVDFRGIFQSCLPPFDPPTDARDFFLWLWEELFPEESYIITDLKAYKVTPNIHEPNRPARKEK